ncbi:winged helix-turn-helix transcriptional regulator [Rhodococcus sp. NPDC003318]|uniref:winged helix-turn-helix transcriptional regulator n=1 Tax=Rhodococcus sp. NPDC003318 TaxID=3364503 RepID=UPI00368AA49A
MTTLSDTVTLLGERWALLVVREVSLGLRRFDELRSATGAPRTVLSDRLRRLVEAGVLGTREYRVPGSRARLEYTLTAAGLDLLPVLAALTDWGERHLDTASVPDVAYRHGGCGGRVEARLVCECGSEVVPGQRLLAQVNR